MSRPRTADGYGVGYSASSWHRVDSGDDLLSESHIPETLVGRERQAEQLFRWLALASTTRAPVHVWMHGPAGAGKTVTVRWVRSSPDSQLDLQNAAKRPSCWAGADKSSSCEHS